MGIYLKRYILTNTHPISGDSVNIILEYAESPVSSKYYSYSLKMYYTDGTFEYLYDDNYKQVKDIIVPKKEIDGDLVNNINSTIFYESLGKKYVFKKYFLEAIKSETYTSEDGSGETYTYQYPEYIEVTIKDDILEVLDSDLLSSNITDESIAEISDSFLAPQTLLAYDENNKEYMYTVCSDNVNLIKNLDLTFLKEVVFSNLFIIKTLEINKLYSTINCSLTPVNHIDTNQFKNINLFSINILEKIDISNISSLDVVKHKETSGIDKKLEKSFTIEKINFSDFILSSTIKNISLSNIIYCSVNISNFKNIVITNLNDFKINVEYKYCTDTTSTPVIKPPPISYRYITYYVIQWQRVNKTSNETRIIQTDELSPDLLSPSSGDISIYDYISNGVIKKYVKAIPIL